MAMPNSADMQLSVGFDLSSIPKSIQTLQASLKSQKIIANIAYQFKTPQGEVRKQIKDLIASLQGDVNSNPLNIPVNVGERDNLPRIRYALYDIANVTGRASEALRDFGASAISAAADFETAFTNVERTTFSNTELLGSMRSQLEGLARDIPIAFGEITEIASLGAQLGIATGDLAGFTETVAQFSAVTNVTTQEAGRSFGALGELLNVGADQYQNLGSAIAQVGVNSVATESEILSVSTQIAGVAASAGLSAEYVVGLSGALASLRIPAEQSRGALTRVFQEINRAAAEGGSAMQGFASVLGVSIEEAQRLAQTDVQSFFSKFIGGLSRLDNTSLTSTLDALNLSELRVTNTLTRLSRNTDLLAQTQGDASGAFEEGTFLAAAYALKVDDLASKLTILQNSLAELSATFGEAILPVVGPLVDALSGAVQRVTDALSTDTGKWVSGIAVGSVFVVSALLSIITAIALVTASLFALQTAITGLGWTAAMGGAKGLAASLWGTSAAAAGATTGVRAMGLAMKALPVVALIGLVYSLSAALRDANNSAEIAFNNIVGTTTGLSDALAADTQAWKDAVASGNEELAASFQTVEYAATGLETEYSNATASMAAAASIVGKDIPSAYEYANGVINENTRAVGDNALAWIQNAYVQSEAFQDMANGFSDVQNAITDFDAQVFGYENLNFSEFFDVLQQSVPDASTFKELAALAVEGGSDAVYEEFKRMAQAAYDGGALTLDQIANVDLALAAQIGMASDNTSDQMYGWVMSLAAGFFDLFPYLEELLKWVGIEIPGAVKDTSNSLGGFGDAVRFSEVELAKLNNNLDTGPMDDYGNSAKGAAEKIYLLTDYANDLASIWDRAFDIRFSGGQTLDKITSAFSKVAQATEDARQQIDELTADIASLEADKALQEYFLTVAEAYGDTLKAQELRANLAKIDADLIKKNKDLSKAQDKTNKTLIGNSDAAIDNRSEILGLVSAYQDHVKALAASGVKEDELRAKTAQLKADFIAQATQLGYNIDELGIYAVAFDDVKRAIDTVPRDLTVDFNGDPALTAIEEFMAKARAALGSGGTFPVRVVSTEKKRLRIDPSDVRFYLQALRLNKMSAEQFDRAVYEYYADGGYVSGPGGPTSDSINAKLSNGEYVMQASAVRQYGVGFFDSLNQMKAPQYFSGGGAVSNSGGMVSLSPEDRAILRNVGASGNIVLYADSRELARSVNDGNRQIVAQGGRP